MMKMMTMAMMMMISNIHDCDDNNSYNTATGQTFERGVFETSSASGDWLQVIQDSWPRGIISSGPSPNIYTNGNISTHISTWLNDIDLNIPISIPSISQGMVLQYQWEVYLRTWSYNTNTNSNTNSNSKYISGHGPTILIPIAIAIPIPIPNI